MTSPLSRILRHVACACVLLFLASCSSKVKPVVTPPVDVGTTPLPTPTPGASDPSQSSPLPPAGEDALRDPNLPPENPPASDADAGDGTDAPPPLAPPPARGGAELFPASAWVTITTAELRANFDFIFAISDIHGTLVHLTPLLKRAGVIMPNSTDQQYVWSGSNVRGRRVLLVVVGDSINKGPDSAAVLMRLKELQDQAATKGGRVIVLLGNHEAEFLAEPSNCDEEFLKSAKKVADVQRGGKLSCKDIGKSFLADFMKTMPVGAVIGSWLWSHSGYLDFATLKAAKTVPQKQAVVVKFLRDTSNARTKGDYATLGDEERSILKTHDWWKPHLSDARDALQILGLNGQVVGHESGFMDAEGEIAMNKFGWILKLDAGMNPEKEESKGRVLKCIVGNILPPRAQQLRMIDERGKPLCSQFGPKQEQVIPLKNF